MSLTNYCAFCKTYNCVGSCALKREEPFGVMEYQKIVEDTKLDFRNEPCSRCQRSVPNKTLILGLCNACREQTALKKQAEAVHHPAHYNTGKIEAIAAIEDWKLGFNLGNTVKYIARAEHKGKKLEDLKKARWYLDREIANLEGGK